MCTLITIRAPSSTFPVVVAANRDERLDRDAMPFGRHWPHLPIRAGKDALAGGTWAGVHDAGFGVFVLNGPGALGPAPGKHSRGDLVPDLLGSGSHDAARRAVASVSPRAYRPFHLVMASAAGVTGVSASASALSIGERPERVVMWTARGANSDASARQRAQRARFEAIGEAWRTDGVIDTLLGELEHAMATPAPKGAPWHAAVCVRNESLGFGTRSSIILAFDRGGGVRVRVADGPPDRTPFREPPV